MADHAVSWFADLGREVRSFGYAFHLDQLSRLERWRILLDVHPYSGCGVLHEKVVVRRIRVRYDGANPDGVAAGGLIRRELADIGDLCQER